ncbi:MAG TPA: hypothetical protein VGX46_19755 [Vicinamibacterales bacterium]|nr:hypothetical protein [Vicinamibacterales bacterium]
MRRIRRTMMLALLAVTAVLGLGKTTAAVQSQAAPSGPADKLIVYGDMAMFVPPGNPENCILRSRFKRGDPVGFRMFVADPRTGNREESAQLVVHVNFAGKTQDIPMRYRATAAQPERQFWVAKWVVPLDAPIGIVRYTVTATDKYGRTGEFKPFEVQESQLTIVE